MTMDVNAPMRAAKSAALRHPNLFIGFDELTPTIRSAATLIDSGSVPSIGNSLP